MFNESCHEYTVVQESNQHAENEIEDLREYEDTDNNAVCCGRILIYITLITCNYK